MKIKCHTEDEGGRRRSVVTKKCHVLFEWPLSYSQSWLRWDTQPLQFFVYCIKCRHGCHSKAKICCGMTFDTLTLGKETLFRRVFWFITKEKHQLVLFLIWSEWKMVFFQGKNTIEAGHSVTLSLWKLNSISRIPF